MIDLLISHGADIDAKDYENGWTALMQATYYGFVCTVIFNTTLERNLHYLQISFNFYYF